MYLMECFGSSENNQINIQSSWFFQTILPFIRIIHNSPFFSTEHGEDVIYVAIERKCIFPPVKIRSKEPSCFKDDFIVTRVIIQIIN